VQTGKRSTIGVPVPDCGHILPPWVITGNIEFMDSQSPGLVQHMLQKGLSLIQKFCLAGAHTGTLAASQQQKRIFFVNCHRYGLLLKNRKKAIQSNKN
jgi:hypothetical protein